MQFVGERFVIWMQRNLRNPPVVVRFEDAR